MRSVVTFQVNCSS